jgi:hypothetical protein
VIVLSYTTPPGGDTGSGGAVTTSGSTIYRTFRSSGTFSFS